MLWCIVSGGEGKKVPSNQNYSCELNFTMVCPSLWSYKPQTKAGSWWAAPQADACAEVAFYCSSDLYFSAPEGASFS